MASQYEINRERRRQSQRYQNILEQREIKNAQTQARQAQLQRARDLTGDQSMGYATLRDPDRQASRALMYDRDAAGNITGARTAPRYGDFGLSRGTPAAAQERIAAQNYDMALDRRAAAPALRQALAEDPQIQMMREAGYAGRGLAAQQEFDIQRRAQAAQDELALGMAEKAREENDAPIITANTLRDDADAVRNALQRISLANAQRLEAEANARAGQLEIEANERRQAMDIARAQEERAARSADIADQAASLGVQMDARKLDWFLANADEVMRTQLDAQIAEAQRLAAAGQMEMAAQVLAVAGRTIELAQATAPKPPQRVSVVTRPNDRAAFLVGDQEFMFDPGKKESGLTALRMIASNPGVALSHEEAVNIMAGAFRMSEEDAIEYLKEGGILPANFSGSTSSGMTTVGGVPVDGEPNAMNEARAAAENSTWLGAIRDLASMGVTNSPAGVAGRVGMWAWNRATD